ncbi:hypothetical protein EDB19DRAFT_1707721 [Suillus lakei]|nr:hypothetical protein EDB19DRAFT_1707721 [Suillus lakei]
MRHNLRSGKVLKGYLDAAGTGLGIGNPNVEFTPNVSACRLTSDGGTARAFWGKRNGEVAVTTAARVMDAGRASSKLIRCKVEDHHDGVVNEIALDPVVSRFVSGGADGQVKLWDTKTVVCLWSSDKQLQSLVVDPFLKVSSALADGIIVGALNSGDIILWTSSEQVHSDDFSSSASFAQHRIMWPISKERSSPQDAVIPKPQPTVLCVRRHSQTTAALLIGYSDHPFFYRVIVDLTSGKYETTAFADSSFGCNSIVEPVFATQPDDCNFIITGDLLGFVGIYDWDTPQTSSFVVPARRFEAQEDGACSARGTATVWDAITLEPLRLFSSPIPRAAPGREVGGVSKIVIEKELLVIIAGNRVMSWKVGQVHHRDAPHKSKHARANKNPIPKGQQRYDLHKVINESKRELEHENAYMRHTMGREREQRSTLDTLGLSESEAVEYVLMLSREEEERRRLSHTIDEGVFEGDFEDETFFPASTSSTAHSSALPASNQSSSNSLYDHHSRTYPRAARPVTNEKVQVSPVFVPEPMEAGVIISPLRIPASLPGSSTGTRSLPEVARSTSSSFEYFPSISSSISSSTSSLEHIRSAWNTPLRSPPSSHESSSPHVDRPILRTPSAPLPSANMDIDGRGSEEELRVPLDLDEMDSDLKVAIELSLAEARSRGEV